MKKNPLLMPCIILSAMCVILIIAAAAVINLNFDLSEKADTYLAENQVLTKTNGELSEKLSGAEKTAEALRSEAEALRKNAAETSSDNVVYIYDNGDTKVEYPDIEGVLKNDYNMELLKISDKKRKALYDENGKKISRFGIDVSSYQGLIDWEKAAADGVEFAFIRAGYRGYESGAMVEDKYFRRNIEGASSAGIDTGAYFFSQALNEAEAAEEADFILSIIEESGAELTLPIVFDWEFPTDEDPARTDNMTGDVQTACCKSFCDRIKDAGYDAMYYSNVNTALFRYDMGELSDYGLWLAEYCEKTQFTYDYQMWQYSCSGVVDGIDALTDLNILIEK